jgi:hypothetical protein
LGFIQNKGLRELAQEASGVFCGEGTPVGIFQGDIPMVRKDGLDQGGFAGLAGTGELHDRILFGRASQLLFQMTRDHDEAPFVRPCNFNIL